MTTLTAAAAAVAAAAAAAAATATAGRLVIVKIGANSRASRRTRRAWLARARARGFDRWGGRVGGGGSSRADSARPCVCVVVDAAPRPTGCADGASRRWTGAIAAEEDPVIL